MKICVPKYWFEWGGTCLWSANDAAREQFGYAVDERKSLLMNSFAKNLEKILKSSIAVINGRNDKSQFIGAPRPGIS